MVYTTQGLMTRADIADHEALTDTGRNPECPGHPDEDGWKGGPFGVTYCSRAENCPDERCPYCDGPLASDRVCADDNCDPPPAWS